MIDRTWIRTSARKPPQGEVVETKIDDSNGPRNEQMMKLEGNLWFVWDGSMYVYYSPTHWRPLGVESQAELRRKKDDKIKSLSREITALQAD